MAKRKAPPPRSGKSAAARMLAHERAEGDTAGVREAKRLLGKKKR